MALEGKIHLMIIDDERSLLDFLRDFFLAAHPEWLVTIHSDYRLALKDPNFTSGGVDIVICDQDLDSDLNGIDILMMMRRTQPQLFTILITALPDLEVAARALRAGISEFVQKQPDWNTKLLNVVESNLGILLGSQAKKETCFAILPFNKWFDECYKDVWKPAAAKAGFEIRRSDDLPSGRPIIREISECLNASDIAIADLTGLNPNVMYEVGLAHGRKKKVVLLTQDVEVIPLDLKHLNFILYDVKEKVNWVKELEASLVRALIHSSRRAGYDWLPW